MDAQLGAEGRTLVFPVGAVFGEAVGQIIVTIGRGAFIIALFLVHPDPAFNRGQRFRGLQAETRHAAPVPDELAFHFRAVRVAGVFDDGQAVFFGKITDVIQFTG